MACLAEFTWEMSVLLKVPVMKLVYYSISNYV